MAPADRARTVLTYLAANEVAATAATIHHNLELYHDADWSRDTTKRRLLDFKKVGYVDYHADIAKGYYAISKAGKFRAEQGISDDELNDIIGAADYPGFD